MDGSKCKKAKVGSKKHDLLIKLEKKVKKKRKRNCKKLKDAPRSVGLLTEIWKPTVQKTLGGLRARGRREGVEGMFFKGLRSEYIKRKTLNEVNEARKKEDLNKIIDIGRVFLQKEEVPENFLPPWKDYGSDKEDLEVIPIKSCKLDFEKEFEEFFWKYEEAVEAQVLSRLPEDGVLEDALKALRKMRIPREDEPEREGSTEREPQFEFNFPSEDLEPEREKFIFSPGKVSLPEIRESFLEKPSESELIMTDVNVENYYHPSFTPRIDNGGGGGGGDDVTESLPSIFRFQERDFEKPAKDLSINTPPIHFYRRNMF